MKGKFKVVPDAEVQAQLENGEEGVLVCARKGEALPAWPHSVVEKCSSCGEEVWVSKTAPAGLKRMCMSCALPEILADVEKSGKPLELFVTETTARETLSVLPEKEKGKLH